MYTLKDDGIINEIESGSNFGYVLGDNGHFVNTDYKVLQSQTNGIFVQCMKLMYNGKVELFYITEDYRPFSSMFAGIMSDTLQTIIINLFANIIEVRNNGFLTSQNIDLSWDKIFVEPNTLKVKLVYLPITEKAFDSYAAFESELRSSLVKLINKVLPSANSRIEQLLLDLANGSLTLDDLYNKMRGNGSVSISGGSHKKTLNVEVSKLRMVAMNAPSHFEIPLDRDCLTIGKKKELVDEVIPFNKMISRKHCKITRQNGSYYITDEGSANGTYVNKTRLVPNQPCQIKKGDILRLADSDFQIV